MITRAGPLAAAAAVVALAAAGDAGRAASMAPVPDLRSATIRLSTVTVAYPARDLTALGPLSLSIDPGELIMLTGQWNREDHPAAPVVAVYRADRGDRHAQPHLPT